MSHDVVVIGAGIGGLTAAIELGASGQRVLVVEAHERVGGKAGCVVVDGAELDTGPSLFTMPDVFDAVLRRAGTSLADELTLRTPEPWFRYQWPDGARLDTSHDLEATLASVRDQFGVPAADAFRAYLMHAAAIWSAAAPAFVLGGAPSLRGLARLGLRALPMLARIEPTRTLRASIRARVREPHLAMLLERYATYNGSDPRRAPATLGCIAHVEFGMGAYGIDGGVAALVRALERAAVRVGVEVRTGTRVGQIMLTHGRVSGVELHDGTRVSAAAVVANADPSHVFDQLLPPRRRPRWPTEPSMSGWTAIVRARRRTASLGLDAQRPGHTVLFPQDYAAEFRDVFEHRTAPADPTVYVCAQARTHGRAGWPEHEPLFVMVNAPAEPPTGYSSAAIWSELRSRVLAKLRAQAVVASDDEIVWERTPRELAAAFPGSRGAIYGSASNTLYSAFLRPANAVRSVPGLYLASGGAHPGGGMPLAALSGRLAARAVLEDVTRGHGAAV